MRVRIGVPEADVGHVTEGAAATVRIPALDATFAGRVSLIGVVADPTTRSYTVEVSVPNPTRRLRAGMVAEATITTGKTTTAMMVPASAVVHDGERCCPGKHQRRRRVPGAGQGCHGRP